MSKHIVDIVSYKEKNGKKLKKSLSVLNLTVRYLISDHRNLLKHFKYNKWIQPLTFFFYSPSNKNENEICS